MTAANMPRPTQQMNKVCNFSRKRDRGAAQAQASSEDRQTTADESVQGRFGWMQLGKCHIPYIFRTGEKYCAVRMVEMKLLNKYLNHFTQDVYNCTYVRSYYITETESKLLNEINIEHSDNQFGEYLFTTKDLVVRLNDAHEFYKFLDVCYLKLIEGRCNPKDRCGFIRINKESVVPYTTKNENKFVPLFYFEGETENLKMKADQVEGWDLSYLKFCCKVQGIRNKLFTHYSCTVINLNAIKNYFPLGTAFDQYWPTNVESQLLLHGNNSSSVEQWTQQTPTSPVILPGPKKCQVLSSKLEFGTGARAEIGGGNLQQQPEEQHRDQPMQAAYSGYSVQATSRSVTKGPGQTLRVLHIRGPRNYKNTTTTRQNRARKRWRYYAQ